LLTYSELQNCNHEDHEEIVTTKVIEEI